MISRMVSTTNKHRPPSLELLFLTAALTFGTVSFLGYDQFIMTKPSDILESRIQTNEAARVYKVSPGVWEKASRNPEIRQALLSMPQEAVDLYAGAKWQEKKTIFRNLHGEISYSIGPMPVIVHKREAFIKGAAFKQSTFKYLREDVDQQEWLSDEQKQQKKDVLTLLEHLKPIQRKALVTLLEAEMESQP